MDLVFAPPGEVWSGVSRQLARLRRSVLVGGLAVVVTVGTIALWRLVGPGAAGGLALAGVGALAWGWWLVGRGWRAWRYAERAEDLLISHGVLFRRLTVVPYGRMQYVDVTAGPLERRFGIATVQLHTASPATDARIPGLPPEEAARLRDRLAALGEARAAGL